MKIEKIKIIYGSRRNFDEENILHLTPKELRENYDLQVFETNSPHNVNILNEIIVKKMQFLNQKNYEFMADCRDKEWNFAFDLLEKNCEYSEHKSFSEGNTMIYVFLN